MIIKDSEWVSVDGKIVSEKDLFSYIDAKYLFLGFGVFSTLLLEQGKIFFINEHQKRLYAHAKFIGINIKKNPINLQAIRNLFSAVSSNNKQNFRLKSIILKKEQGYQSLLFLKKYERQEKMSVTCGNYLQTLSSNLARIKSLSYLERALIHEKAVCLGLDDMISSTKEGYLLEGSYSNLFWIEGDQLFTPTFQLPILKGITLRTILKIAPKLKLKVCFVKKKLNDISKNAAVFRCNSLLGIQSIQQIDSEIFPVKEDLFNQLNHEYEMAKKKLALII